MTSARPGFEELQAALRQRSIRGLDGLRAFAVLAVVIYHAGWERVNGSQGVLVFFTLSGFLITWLLLAEGEVDLKRFYARRALRLFPAFYAYWFGMVALLTVTHREIHWGSALSAFFYSVNYYNATHDHPASFISHGWSLAVEEQFYLLWPLVFLRLRKDLNRLARVLGVVIVLTWIYRGAAYFIGVSDAWLYNAFDCRLDHLLVGCLGAVLLRMRAAPKLFGLIAGSRALGASVALTLFLIGWFELELGRAFLFVVAHAIEPPLVMALILFVVANASSAPVKWLDAKPLAHVGKVSYGIYLFHQAIHGPVLSATRKLPEPVPTAAVVLVSIAIASLSYRFFERPFLALKDRLHARKPPRKESAADERQKLGHDNG